MQEKNQSAQRREGAGKGKGKGKGKGREPNSRKCQDRMHVSAGTGNRTRDSLVQSEGRFAVLTCFPLGVWNLFNYFAALINYTVLNAYIWEDRSLVSIWGIISYTWNVLLLFSIHYTEAAVALIDNVKERDAKRTSQYLESLPEEIKSVIFHGGTQGSPYKAPTGINELLPIVCEKGDIALLDLLLGAGADPKLKGEKVGIHLTFFCFVLFFVCFFFFFFRFWPWFIV